MRSEVLNSNSSNFALPPSKGIVKIESKIIPFTGDTKLLSGAMTIPANSIITRLTAVVKDAITISGSSTVGVKAGTAAEGTQFTGTLDADNLEGSGTSVAAGVGCSTDDVLTVGLGGTAIMGALAASYRAAETDVHFTALSSSGNFTAGAIWYSIEYIELDNN